MKVEVSCKAKKLTSLVVAVLIILSLMPFGWITTALAADVSSFDVQLSVAIENATVTMVDENDGANTFIQNTDATGKAQFINVLDDATTYAISISGITGYSYTPESGVTVSEGGSHNALLTALGNISVTGTVQDTSGTPIPDAAISASGYAVASETSAADGTFTLTLYQGQAYTVDINLTGYSSQSFSLSSGAISPAYDSDDNVDLGIVSLDPLETIDVTGVLHDSHGDPVAGAIVSASGYHAPSDVTSGADGSFALTLYKDQVYTIEINKTGYNRLTFSTSSAPPTLDTSADCNLGTLTLSKIALAIDTTAGAGGTITPDAEVEYGKDQDIIITPDYDAVGGICYSLGTVEVDGVPVAVSTTADPTDLVDNDDGTYTYTFYDVTGDHEIEASFVSSDAPTVYNIVKDPSAEWSAGSVTVSVSASVAGGNIGEVRYSSDPNDYSTDRYRRQLTAVTDLVYDGVSGKYTFTITSAVSDTYYIWAYDTTGHKSVRSEVTVNIDQDDPQVVSFSITKPSFAESVLNLLTFGAFGNGTIDVTVNVSDSGISSGLQAVSLYKYDTSGVGTLVGTDVSLSGSVDSATFSIPVSFTGTLKAVVKDNVGRSSVETAATSTNSNLQDGAGSIMLEVVSPTLSITPMSEAAYTDPDGKKWYPGDVGFTVSTGDTDAGIYSVQIDINGTSIIDNDYFSSKTTNESFNVSTTQATMAADGSYTVTVTVTDNAGNIRTGSLIVYKDITKPVISVTYDNIDDDDTFDGYYKANRTATIRITERNFNPADVDIALSNTHGTTPGVPTSWSKTVNGSDPDQTTYTATITFAADGDYTFGINCSDCLGNESADYAQNTFTIDKTIPVIKVSYDNDSSLNSNYYQDTRTATITITEHNFETGRINIQGTATNAGEKVDFPSVGRWTNSGDKHTATIIYDADAHYTFDISYADEAGNSASEYSADAFYIDTTAPVLAISGVNNHSANNGDVVPVVEYTDLNYNDVTIQLKGANRGDCGLLGDEQSIENGGRFTFANFEAVKEVDDIYTLTATAVDKAGNETSTSIVFSVNRFGSVYVFADSVKAVEEKYIQKGLDVVITETNVDKLETHSIKVSKNGTITDLVEEKDYTIEQSGGEGEWSQYTYTINASLFSGDGKYIISLYSVDAAGNVNENSDETKEAELWFGVDKTAPVIVPIDIAENTTYPEDSKTATISVDDNLVLDSVTILVNDEAMNYTQNGSEYTFTMNSSNSAQTIKVVARDAAGNEFTLELPRVYVTTNIIIRWYANTALFIGSLCGVGLLIIAVIVLVIIRRRKTA